MARLGTIALSRRTDHRGIPRGEAEFEAALAQLHELIEYESPAVLATVSEQRMRRTLQARGWTVLTAPGHRFNAPGPDAIAWLLEPGYELSVMTLDNEATTTTHRRTVSKATGLQAPSLVRHLDGEPGGRLRHEARQWWLRDAGQRAASRAVRTASRSS